MSFEATVKRFEEERAQKLVGQNSEEVRAEKHKQEQQKKLIERRVQSSEWALLRETANHAAVIEGLLHYWKTFSTQPTRVETAASRKFFRKSESVSVKRPLTFAECLTVTESPEIGQFGVIEFKLQLSSAEKFVSSDAHGDIIQSYEPAHYLQFKLEYYHNPTVIQKETTAPYPGKNPVSPKLSVSRGVAFIDVNFSNRPAFVASGVDAFLDLLASSIATNKPLH